MHFYLSMKINEEILRRWTIHKSCNLEAMSFKSHAWLEIVFPLPNTLVDVTLLWHTNFNPPYSSEVLIISKLILISWLLGTPQNIIIFIETKCFEISNSYFAEDWKINWPIILNQWNQDLLSCKLPNQLSNLWLVVMHFYPFTSLSTCY